MRDRGLNTFGYSLLKYTTAKRRRKKARNQINSRVCKSTSKPPADSFVQAFGKSTQETTRENLWNGPSFFHIHLETSLDQFKCFLAIFANTRVIDPYQHCLPAPSPSRDVSRNTRLEAILKRPRTNNHRENDNSKCPDIDRRADDSIRGNQKLGRGIL